MENRWDDTLEFDDPVEECVYGSRLIGSDPDLVLHGGGNTSVKAIWRDYTGEDVDALYVKGSGWDLAHLEAPGLTPLPLARLHDLLELDALADPDMVAALSAARLNPSSPQPSIETLLHARIPYRAVQHSHADVIVNLTNLENGSEVVEEAFGPDIFIVPYVMPGFDLAKKVAQSWSDETDENTVGMVLMNHGLFTFGDTTREAYARHIDLITRAERFLEQRAPLLSPPPKSLGDIDPIVIADLRHDISRAAGSPMILTRHRGEVVSRFVSRPDLESLAGRGPLTPDHIIRTKRVPMVGRDVDSYVGAYTGYFADNRAEADEELTMLDPAPRVVLDPELGMLTAGRSIKEATISADIYHHSIPVMERAEDHLGGYRALDEANLFDVEYWDLEQAKLRRGGSPPPMSGQVAVVTGAASGIGRACVSELLDRGAAVVGVDVSEKVPSVFDNPAFLGVEADVTDQTAMTEGLRMGVERFGGVDLAVLAAGVFGSSSPVAELDPVEWRRIQEVNVESAVTMLRLLHPLLVRSPAAPAVTMIASKNVPAPGKGAAAYSTSKAALTQLSRVTALEWADHGIRVNMVHPDAVFDTGLWTPELLAERAEKYGMSVDEYKRRNLLSTEVTSETVAGVVVELLSDRFSATTGAQIPIDGGSERVI
ncbi:MAG: bifunctional aldolase/short-chain dehydrogenase [Acidimicrobiia bacterium]|nr:bifunctional aldolase/short-chain dehydrogenase [Acidimicrobiia bacterium]